MGTLVNTGAALELSNNVTVLSEALRLSGTGVSATPGALRNATGDNTWNGDITLEGDTTFASDSGRLTVGSALTLTHEGAARRPHRHGRGQYDAERPHYGPRPPD